MKQVFKDIINATKNRKELEELRAAVRETSSLVDPKRASLRIENYRYRNRRDYLFELLGEEFHPFGDFRNSKLGWREVITQLSVPGLELPKLYGTAEDILDIQITDLPDNFVIKPDSGVNTLGVLPLRKSGQLAYINQLTGEEKAWSKHIEDFNRTKNQNRIRLSTQLLVEELLVDSNNPNLVPADWKFTFGAGKLMLISRVRRFPAGNKFGFENRFLYWDSELIPHPDIHKNRVPDQLVELPSNIRQMIEIAELIATSFAQPVCRVDMYNLPGRIVFGEYTPNPGGHYAVDKAQDERLGKLWLEAETRYNAMLIKKLQETGHPKYGLGIWKP